MLETFLLILMIAGIAPIVAFYCAKLVSYGWSRGKYLADKQNENGDGINGDE